MVYTEKREWPFVRLYFVCANVILRNCMYITYFLWAKSSYFMWIQPRQFSSKNNNISMNSIENFGHKLYNEEKCNLFYFTTSNLCHTIPSYTQTFSFQFAEYIWTTSRWMVSLTQKCFHWLTPLAETILLTNQLTARGKCLQTEITG